MQRIYSHPDIGVLNLVKNELDNRGIETEVRGEHLVAVVGGGAPFDAWYELWVLDERRLQEAARVVREAIEPTDVGDGEPWVCPRCEEEIEPQFAVCWSCGRERPDQGT